MRRTALYLAGAVVATGAAMAFAGPASAATHATASCSLYYCDSYTNNLQYLNQRQYTSQMASVSSGNSQNGFFNVIGGGGSASNSSNSSITGYNY